MCAKVEGFLTLATDFLADHLGRLLSGKFRNGFSLSNCVSLHKNLKLLIKMDSKTLCWASEYPDGHFCSPLKVYAIPLPELRS